MSPDARNSAKGAIARNSFTTSTGGESGSRVDAAIWLRDHGLLVIETKVVGDLVGDQLTRHALRWDIPVPTFPCAGDPDELPKAWQFCSWPSVYRWAREEALADPPEPSRLLIRQFVEYLDLSGVAPYRGLWSEHFDFFALPPDERAPEMQAELKARLRGLWELMEEQMSESERNQLGRIHVANLKVTDDQVAVFGDLGVGKVNVTSEFGQRDLQLNLVGWNAEQAARLEQWILGDAERDSLTGYELVPWVRKAHEAASGKPFWMLSTQIECNHIELDRATRPEIAQRLDAIREQLDPKWQRLAFHVRRTFSKEEVVDAGEEIVPRLAAEVKHLLPVVGAINRGRG
jgi:hypothetical protein